MHVNYQRSRKVSAMNHLFGMTCATITPMFADGSIDLKSAANLYRHLIASNVHCLYPNGTNSESLSLKKEEREVLAQRCVREASGRAVVYIQCGALDVQESYSHVLHAKSIGADGAGLMTPVFFPVDEPGMKAYYTCALDLAQDFPVYVYNIASRTGNDVSVDLMSCLSSQYCNLLGIKFSSSDLQRLIQYVNIKDFDVLIGNDRLALACLSLGGKGYVSGPGAAFPCLYASLYEAFKAGELAKTMQIQQSITHILEQMKDIPEIPAIKYLLMRQGVIAHDTCRPPLRALTPDEKKQMDTLL